jgi:hypothetical protein
MKDTLKRLLWSSDSALAHNGPAIKGVSIFQGERLKEKGESKLK